LNGVGADPSASQLQSVRGLLRLVRKTQIIAGGARGTPRGDGVAHLAPGCSHVMPCGKTDARAQVSLCRKTGEDRLDFGPTPGPLLTNDARTVIRPALKISRPTHGHGSVLAPMKRYRMPVPAAVRAGISAHLARVPLATVTCPTQTGYIIWCGEGRRDALAGPAEQPRMVAVG
jgi:hypothetical protein